MEMPVDVDVGPIVDDVKLSVVLEMLAQKAVKHIDEAPCMHILSKGGVHERHTVPSVVVEVPQVCEPWYLLFGMMSCLCKIGI